MESYNRWLFLSGFFVFKFYPCCSLCQYFIPFCGQIIFHCMDTLHFVYAFIGWLLSNFRFGPTVNNAAMKIHIQVFVWIHTFISLGYIPRNGITGWCLTFWWIYRYFAKLLHYSAFLPAMYQSSSFLVNTCYCLSFFL